MEEKDTHAQIIGILRLTGLLYVVGALLQIVSAVLNLLYPDTLVSRGVARDEVNVFIGSSVAVTVVIVGAALWWIRHTLKRWEARDPRGLRHAKWLGIVLIVLGLLGLTSGAAEFGAIGTSSGVVTALSAMALIAWAISGATFSLGVLLLVRRNKAGTTAAFPSALQEKEQSPAGDR